MKKSYSTAILLAIIWILLSAAAVEGCGWRKVDKGERINFNWDSYALEVKTKELSSDSIEDKQLEIMFEKQTGGVAVKIWNFYLTQNDYNGVKAETLNFGIRFREEVKLCSIRKPSGELRWRFKKLIVDRILVEIAGTVFHEDFSIPDDDKTEMLQFGSADNISLLYRVTSTDGDDDCVKPGNKTSNDTITMQNLCFFN